MTSLTNFTSNSSKACTITDTAVTINHINAGGIILARVGFALIDIWNLNICVFVSIY